MRLLILNQSFHPDVVSTAQHATDLALSLVECGHEVHVLTGRRAYDSPERRFAAKECWNRIRITRIGTLGLGKASKWRRALDFGSFWANAAIHIAAQPRYDVVLAMTSPPLISTLAAAFTSVRGGDLVLWLMDLNPDEAIAAGWLRSASATARLLKSALMFSMRRARRIIALDRFMADRVMRKGLPRRQIEILPPWSHDADIVHDESGRLRFRARHGLTSKFVVMYSGNHSPCHPLESLLGAARALALEPDYAFVFVGGGSEFRKAQAYARYHDLGNITFLPYQPREELSSSLSSADLHVVVLGEPFVGIVHPCKVYNILRLGIPLLYIGPERSHITDLASGPAHGSWFFESRTSDVRSVVDEIRRARKTAVRQSADQLRKAEQYSASSLIPRMLDAVTGAQSCKRVVHSEAKSLINLSEERECQERKCS